jgi:hypothetical protein
MLKICFVDANAQHAPGQLCADSWAGKHSEPCTPAGIPLTRDLRSRKARPIVGSDDLCDLVSFSVEDVLP